jgi:hypothetical protein
VHPTVQKVSTGTVNKQLGTVQAIAGWGRHNGLVPEEAPWPDPFSEMRLEEEQSQREPFDARDLQTIFDALFPNISSHRTLAENSQIMRLPRLLETEYLSSSSRKLQ